MPMNISKIGRSENEYKKGIFFLKFYRFLTIWPFEASWIGRKENEYKTNIIFEHFSDFSRFAGSRPHDFKVSPFAKSWNPQFLTARTIKKTRSGDGKQHYPPKSIEKKKTSPAAIDLIWLHRFGAPLMAFLSRAKNLAQCWTDQAGMV